VLVIEPLRCRQNVRNGHHAGRCEIVIQDETVLGIQRPDQYIRSIRALSLA
jgi:hypothetical protein